MNVLKRYIFWTYERGSFHYDVMVTLILLFIFVSPHLINFGERPVPDEQVHGHDVLIQASAGGDFVYQVNASQVKRTDDADTLRSELGASIAPIAGPLQLDRYEALKDKSGRVSAYRVFAHRRSDSRVQ